MNARIDDLVLEERLMSMTPQQLEIFVADVLRANSSRFANVSLDPSRTRHLVDIYADDLKRQNRAYFEVKRQRVASASLVRSIASTASKVRSADPGAAVILVIPGLPTAEAIALAAEARVQIWGRLSLSELTPPRLFHSLGSPMLSLPEQGAPRVSEVENRDKLASIPRGTVAALAFQREAIRIFESLFVPPLDPPLPEHSDRARRNRRDAIFGNSSAAGFWKETRRRYQADYIVVDAKNHAAGPRKREVNDVAAYLKPHGSGLFAIILCRTSPKESALHAAREHWIESRKMIVMLCDDDLIKMSRYAENGGSPEEIIRLRINEFRLGF